MSVARYVATCHPFWASKKNLSSLSRAIKIILVIWLIGFFYELPSVPAVCIRVQQDEDDLKKKKDGRTSRRHTFNHFFRNSNVDNFYDVRVYYNENKKIFEQL